MKLFRPPARGPADLSGSQPRPSRLGFVVCASVALTFAAGQPSTEPAPTPGSPAGGTAAALPARMTPAPIIERRGPWGVLRIRPLRLVQSDDLLAAFIIPPAELWAFGRQPWTEVDATLDTLNLPPVLRRLLDQPDRRFEPAPPLGEHVIRPPDEVRLALTADQRARLYRHLAEHGGNPAHAVPVLLPADAVLAAAPLSAPVRERLRQLTFTDGPDRYLADLDLVLAAAVDATEWQALRRLLLSFPSLAVDFLRESLTDRDTVQAYWSRPGTSSADRWLRTLERSPATLAIDLAQLLPPLPRRWVNTFADGAAVPPDANCFWTSLNFFRTTTDDAFLPFATETDHCAELTRAELERHYTPVAEPPYRYGDVLLFSDPRRSPAVPTHAVVYLAGDLVFTKNGWGPSSPFALGFLTEVTRRYNWAGQLRLQAFRPIPGSPALPLPAPAPAAP